MNIEGPLFAPLSGCVVTIETKTTSNAITFYDLLADCDIAATQDARSACQIGVRRRYFTAFAVRNCYALTAHFRLHSQSEPAQLAKIDVRSASAEDYYGRLWDFELVYCDRLSRG
jgi:hypothetical protein